MLFITLLCMANQSAKMKVSRLRVDLTHYAIRFYKELFLVLDLWVIQK